MTCHHVSHFSPTASSAWAHFQQWRSTYSFTSRQSLSMSPCFSTLVPKNAICSHFSLRRLVLGLFHHLNLLPFVFSNTLRDILALGSCLLHLEVLVCFDFSSLWLLKGAHPHLWELFLRPNDYKEYLHLTQATKFASISSVAQTGNTSACLSHSSGL